MPPKKQRPSERRVVMAHNVARQWLFQTASPEFRFRVFTAAEKIAKQQEYHLRRFRDGARASFEGVSAIPDLGIKIEGDSIHVWSRYRKALIELKDYFEKHGFETTGVW